MMINWDIPSQKKLILAFCINIGKHRVPFFRTKEIMHFKDVDPCISLLALFFLDVSCAEFHGKAIKHNKLRSVSCYQMGSSPFSLYGGTDFIHSFLPNPSSIPPFLTPSHP